MTSTPHTRGRVSADDRSQSPAKSAWLGRPEPVGHTEADGHVGNRDLDVTSAEVSHHAQTFVVIQDSSSLHDVSAWLSARRGKGDCSLAAAHGASWSLKEGNSLHTIKQREKGVTRQTEVLQRPRALCKKKSRQKQNTQGLSPAVVEREVYFLPLVKVLQRSP